MSDLWFFFLSISFLTFRLFFKLFFLNVFMIIVLSSFFENVFGANPNKFLMVSYLFSLFSFIIFFFYNEFFNLLSKFFVGFLSLSQLWLTSGCFKLTSMVKLLILLWLHYFLFFFSNWSCWLVSKCSLSLFFLSNFLSGIETLMYWFHCGLKFLWVIWTEEIVFFLNFWGLLLSFLYHSTAYRTNLMKSECLFWNYVFT